MRIAKSTNDRYTKEAAPGVVEHTRGLTRTLDLTEEGLMPESTCRMCESPKIKALGLCGKHYNASRAATKPPCTRCQSRPQVAKGLCNTCYQGDWSKAHPAAMSRAADRARERAAEVRAAKARALHDAIVGNEMQHNRPILKTDPTTYAGAHARVRNYRGRPWQYDCACGCGDPATEWAFNNNMSSAYVQIGERSKENRRVKGGDTRTTTSVWSSNPFDYDPLCSECHRKRDEAFINSGTGRQSASD